MMIELVYDLDKKDFLNSQLYVTSMDENFEKRRKKERLRMAGISFLFACILFFDEGYLTYSYLFFGASILYFIFYPWWSAWYYKRMYRQQIERHFKGSLPFHMNVNLSEEYIHISTIKGVKQIEASRISSIEEIKDYFFLIEDISFTAIIIPKKSLSDEKIVKDCLINYSESFNAKYSSNLDWEWK